MSKLFNFRFILIVATILSQFSAFGLFPSGTFTRVLPFRITGSKLGGGIFGIPAAVGVSFDSAGKLYAIGDFYTASGTSYPSIMKILANGTVDTSTFKASTTGFTQSYITSVAWQSDGKPLVVVGANSYYDGQAVGAVVRLNTNGTVDSTFSLPASALSGTDYIGSIFVDRADRIYVSGSFTSLYGTAVNYLARLNSDGTLDTSFNPGTSFGQTVSINIYFDSQNRLIVYGNFTAYNGTSISRLARILTTGAIDATFAIQGTGFDSGVSAVVTDSNDKLIVGGDFTSYNSTSSKYIIKLNTDGTIDSSFTVGTGFTGSVMKLVMLSSGKVYAAGGFLNYNGASTGRIVRLNTDGTLDSAFTTASGFTSLYNFSNLIVQSDGKLVVTGLFIVYASTSRYYILRLNTDGTLETTLNSSATVIDREAIGIHLDGSDNLYIVGNFMNTGATGVKNLIRFNTNGTHDSTFSIGTGFNFTNSLMGVRVDSSDKVYAWGFFTTVNGSSRKNIVRFNSDGTVDAGFTQTGTGLSTTVLDVALDSSSRPVVVGGFTTYNGTSRPYVARLTTAGALDTTFAQTGTGLNANANTVAITSTGTIVVGGSFTSYNGTSTPGVARLLSTGALDTSFAAVGTGLNGTVNRVAVTSAGKVYVLGNFTSYNGTAVQELARLNSNGSLDTTFTPQVFDYAPSTLTLDSQDRLYVGGAFTTYGSEKAPGLIRLQDNGKIDHSFNYGTGSLSSILYYGIQSMAWDTTNRKLGIGGDFNGFNQNTSAIGVATLQYSF